MNQKHSHWYRFSKRKNLDKFQFSFLLFCFLQMKNKNALKYQRNKKEKS